MKANNEKAAFFDFFQPHFGEVLFHDFTLDDFVLPKSNSFFDLIVQNMGKILSTKKVKFLEIAPNKNIIGYMIAEKYSAEGCLFDMSKRALLKGRDIARSHGFQCELELATGDFRDLPYENESFDFVYMSGAIHHSYVPQSVAREAARVLKPGGHFFLINEPVERLASTYSYQGSRVGDSSSTERFEEVLSEAGLTGFLSYPMIGGRSEELFGMTENWGIPLNVYENLCEDIFELESAVYEPHLLSDFEKELFQAMKDEFSVVLEKFKRAVTDVNDSLTPSDLSRMKSFGFSIPSMNAMKAVILRAYTNYRQAYDKGHDKESEARAQTIVFGGRIHLIYKKSDNSVTNKTAKEEKQLFTNTLSGYGFSCDLEKNLFPDIQESDEEQPLSSDLERVMDGPNVSLINKSNDVYIDFPANAVCGVFGVRIFSVHDDKDYDVMIYNGEHLIKKHRVIRSESWGGVFLCEQTSSKIKISIVGLPKEKAVGYLRLGTLNFFEMSPNN